MSQRGRRKNKVRSVRIVLSGWLNPEIDADILAWWNAIPSGQRMIAFKTMLRNGGMNLASAPDADAQSEIQAAADDLLSNWEF